MTASWVIESLCAEDLDQVMRIEQASFRHPWPREAFLPDATYAPSARALVLRRGGDPSGRVRGYIFFWMVEDEMEIQNIAVAADSRRHGGGDRLLGAAIEVARSRGCRTAYLEVRPSNAAGLALYLKWGFVRAGRRRRYYRDGEDALVMRAELPTAQPPHERSSSPDFLKAPKGGC